MNEPLPAGDPGPGEHVGVPEEVSLLLDRNFHELIECFDIATEKDSNIASAIILAVTELARRLSQKNEHVLREQRPSSSHLPAVGTTARPPSSHESGPPRKRQRLSDTADPSHGDLAPSPNQDEPFPTTSPPRRKSRGSTGKRAPDVVVEPSSFAISHDCGPTEVSQIRTAFHADLLKLQTVAKRDGKDESVSFTTEEADELTQYFFDEIMGRQTLRRLAALARMYAGSEEHDRFDAGVGVRLKKIAYDKHAPQVIRKFFGSFIHQQESNTQQPVLVHLQRIIQSRELLINYNRLRRHLDNGDPEVLTFLRDQGLTASVGRGWTSIAIDFLADQVGLKRTAFVNTCERAKGINQLVDQFGEGILPLLPPGAMYKLRRYGNQRMGPAYELLKRHVASFQPICDLTYTHVYLPLVSGAASLPIDIPSLTKPKSQNLVDIMNDATHNDDHDATPCDDQDLPETEEE